MKISEFLDQIEEKRLSIERVSLKSVDTSILTEGLWQTFVDNIKKTIKATKIFLKKIKGKLIVLFSNGSETGVILPSTKKVVMKWSGNTVYVNPFLLNKQVANESKKTFGNILNELKTKAEIQMDAEKRIQKLYGKVQEIEGASDDALMQIENADVDFDDLKTVFEQLAFSVKFRTEYSQKVPAILLMGPPGGGKTTIGEFFGNEKGMIVQKLEIASLYEEMIGGFPTVEKILRGEIKGSDIDRKKLGEEQYEMVVKIKASDLLPPSKDPRPWVLFLDEFNRDEKKMAAVMNLCLTGNIGDSYYLPLKTLIIASGNVGNVDSGGDDVKVAQLDMAMWDRFDRKVLLNHDWGSRHDFGEKSNVFGGKEAEDTPFGARLKEPSPEITNKRKWFKAGDEKYDMGGDPTIIANWIARKDKDNLGKNWTETAKQFNKDHGAIITPRTMSILSKNMQSAALLDWVNDDLVGSKDKEYYEKNWEEKGFASAPAYYLHVNQTNSRYFADIARTTLGAEPAEMIMDMLQGLQLTAAEAKNIQPIDVLTDWTNLRKSKKAPPTSLGTAFTTLAANILNDYSEKEFDKLLKSKKIEIPESLNGDAAGWVTVNIHNFIIDSKIQIDAVAGLAKKFAALREPAPKESKNKDKDTLQFKNEFVNKIITLMIKKSPIFLEAWTGVTGVAEGEAKKKKPAAFNRAFLLSARGKLANGPVPKYVTDNLSGEKLKSYLMLTNLQILIPSMKVDKLDTREEETKKMEESIRTIFNTLK